MIKVCVICKKAFFTENGNKTCSEECRKKRLQIMQHETWERNKDRYKERDRSEYQRQQHIKRRVKMGRPVDQNGRALAKRVRREEDGTWGANVWSGNDPATTLRRYFYETKKQAWDADISDEPGKRGCVRFGEYAYD